MLGQNRRFELTTTRDGMIVDYPKDAGWRKKASSVAEYRARLWFNRQLGILNSAAALEGPEYSPAALTGVLYVPTVLMTYPDWHPMLLPEASEYDSLLYGASAPAGVPYSVRTYYEELSNGVFSVQGKSYGWIETDSGRAYYANACGLRAPPVSCEVGRQHAYEAFMQILTKLDTVVDFSQYDNDGFDGVPNSGDDDGVVDVLQFIHADRGAECLGTSFWAHKWSLAALGGAAFETDDAAAGGGSIIVDPYQIVAGFGGLSCLEYDQIMPIGVAAHELGHALGLPDLYDTDPYDEDDSQGIGEWGLMGAASYTSPSSPGHLSAWSKERLGWVTVVGLSVPDIHTVGPVVSSDTVFRIQPAVSNPRGEYFLLESKQPVGSDTANLGGGQFWDPKPAGLLVWHIDSLRIAEAEPFNRVNTGLIHGVAVLGEYPGTSTWPRYRLSHMTSPAAVLNHDASFAGFALDSINQVVPGGEMIFKFANGVTTIATSDTGAWLTVDGKYYHQFEDVFFDGRIHNVAIDSLRVGTGAYFLFENWSDGGARVHEIVGSSTGATITAQVDPRYWLGYRASRWTSGLGEVVTQDAVGFDTLLDNGLRLFLPGGTTTLKAVPKPGSIFTEWHGTVESTEDTLFLEFDRSFDLEATFLGTLAVVRDTLMLGHVGKPYSDTLRATGGVGDYQWVERDYSVGLHLNGDGVLAGIPDTAGNFNLSTSVISGEYRINVQVRVPITAPAVDTAAIIDKLLDLPSSATQEETDYFDFMGNRNGRLDVGDFLLWLRSQVQNSAAKSAPQSTELKKRGGEDPRRRPS